MGRRHGGVARGRHAAEVVAPRWSMSTSEQPQTDTVNGFSWTGSRLAPALWPRAWRQYPLKQVTWALAKSP